MKKLLSILLVAVMLFTMVPASVFAAETTSVKLVSFMRGDVSDLRSSELLEVQVEGYDGNPRELTYKWTSSLGTYLYIYNSHNMYGINNTYGEYEIYNTDKKINRSSNVEEDRSGNKTLALEGFMWASVYGAYTYNGGSASSALKGTVEVEVFDKNGNSLGSDSFSSFKEHNLDGDLDNVVIGLFEGDRKNVLDLLGESGIVHITCTSSSVSSADILNGDEHIDIETEKKDKNTYNYFIKGVKAGDNSTNGDAQLVINVKKSSCKFHYNTSGDAKPIVYVFKKPKTATTTTTLTLVDNIDDRCTYFIDGVEGEKQDDGTIIFTGLTPNTDYTVEVRAEYDDNGETKYVYGYVDDTTKPVYSAKIYTYLDGTLTDFESIYGDGAELLIRENNAYSDYVSLSETSTGIYEAPLYNGVFNPYVKADGAYNKIGNYQLVIEHANAELHLYHYSVKYDTNGGAFKAGEEVGAEVYAARNAVNATSNVPVRDGFIFMGWDYSGNTIGSGKQITSSITAPVTLKAKWEKAVNVTINVTIDHNSKDGGYDQVETRADLDVDFLEMTSDSPAFVETGDKLHFTKDDVTDENGNKKDYSYTLKDNVSIYTATDYTYTGFLESSAFGVALSKSDYDVTLIEKKQDSFGNWIINISLEHAPSNFDIEFSLEMADDVPPELYPDAAIVKIAFWNGKEWEIITQQASTDVHVKPGVRVDIDPVTGEGFGSYPVWKYADSNDPYGYRAVVTGFVYGDSAITVPTESINGKIATYTDGEYTATMGAVDDGAKFGETLNGAYYNDATDSQKGTLHGVITVEKYDVTFDANGGTINSGNTYTEEDEYYVPDIKDYVPEFDGHEFKGWYKDPEFKEPAVTGEILKDNITLYAKWDQILTGYVRVAGSYMQDGNIVNVWSVDRANSAVIALKEITADGAYVIDTQTVDIAWPMSEMIYGISEEYKFTGLDPAKTYRTEVLILNYGTTYQNSTTAVDGDDDYADDYNADDFTAVYPESSKWETFVNAHLTFEPASYFQPVEVDATLIGEGLRPDDTLVEIWYKATGTDNAYQVISQHTVVPYGIEIGMDENGMDDGDYGYTVWNSVYDGNLYDYQAYLSKIENDKAAEWPVSVVYGAPSRYSPLHDAPTGVLQVKIIPNRYGIVYNENYIDEGVNVVSYGTHIWSYETVLDYIPEREGYIFEGWYSNPECTGDKVTVIAATVANDTELYAKWEKAEYGYTVNYLEEGTDNVLAAAKTAEAKFDEAVTESAITIDGYTLVDDESKTIIIDTENNVINFYYAADSFGGGDDGDEGDGTPDKYQKKVIFKVVNGTWSDGTATDKTVYLDLMKDGKYAADGSASLTAPTGMKANEGFKNGSWDAEIPSTVSGTETLTFTYSFIRSTTPVEPLDSVSYIVEHYKENADGTYSLVEEDTEILTGKIGNTVTATAKTYEDYCLNIDRSEATSSGVLKSISNASDILILKLYYDIDKVGGEDGDDGDEGDGTPDKYQKKVIFKVVNGTWSDGTATDKTVYLDLMKDGKYAADGSASLTAPTGMKANEGYGNGEWKVIPPAVVSGTATETYTYSYNIKSYSYTVNYLEEGTDEPLAESKSMAELYGTEVTEKAKSITGYTPVGETKKTITISASGNVINFYYSVDDIGVGDDGESSDGIPDKYQKKVIFKVVNGKWSNGKANEIVNVVTLVKDGKYAADGSASLTAPTGMKANEGFEGGSWDVTPPSTVSGLETLTFTYSFTEVVPEEPENPGNPDTPTDPDTPDAPGGEGNGNGSVSGAHHIVFGKTDGIGWYHVSQDGGQSWDIVFGNSTYEVKNGTELIIKAGDILGDSFTFYVNGDAVKPNDDGEIRVTVKGYMLIGAIGIDPDIDLEVPDVDESLNWFQKLIKAIKDFFAKLFGKK